MSRLTEHLTLPPGEDYRPAVQPDTFDDLGDDTPNTDDERRRAVKFVLGRLGMVKDADRTWRPTEGSREVLLALFGKGQPVRINGNPMSGAAKPAVADPATTPHKTGDIGPWRAQVAAWGRENGWPDATGRQPLEPDLVAAYRAAHPRASRPYDGPSPEAVALRKRMREFGAARGLPYSSHGTPNPLLVAAYYAAHPEEKP